MSLTEGYNPVMAEHTITLEQARHVAKLARLDLSDDRLQTLSPQLGSILTYMATIEQADTTGIDPMPHAVPLTNVLREDIVGPILKPSQVLQNAPATDGPFFAVPKVIGSEEDSAG